MKKKFLFFEIHNNRKDFIFDYFKNREDLEIYLVAPEITPEVLNFVSEENVILYDFKDTKKLLELVGDFILKNDIKFDMVGTFNEICIFDASIVADTLGLSFIKPGSVVKSSRNKGLMRKFCKDFGIAMPKFKIISFDDLNSLKLQVNNFDFPFILKPISGFLSVGVKKIEKESDLNDFILELERNSEDSLLNFFGESYLVEEYLSGDLMSIDGVVNNGEIIVAGMVEFLMGPEPNFVQEANIIPARVEQKVFDNCKDLLSKVIEALEFDNCAFHCELRIDNGIPKLVEIGCRAPGGPLIPGYEKVSGFNFLEIMLKIWSGEKVDLNLSNDKVILQKAHFEKEPGTLKNFNQFVEHNNLYNFVPILNNGDKINSYQANPVPVYFVEIEADNFDDLEKYEKEIHTLTEIVIKKD